MSNAIDNGTFPGDCDERPLVEPEKSDDEFSVEYSPVGTDDEEEEEEERLNTIHIIHPISNLGLLNAEEKREIEQNILVAEYKLSLPENEGKFVIANEGMH